MDKINRFANTLTIIGKNMTLFITVPILLYIFLGTSGLVIGGIILILYAISKKRR